MLQEKIERMESSRLSEPNNPTFTNTPIVSSLRSSRHSPSPTPHAVDSPSSFTPTITNTPQTHPLGSHQPPPLPSAPHPRKPSKSSLCPPENIAIAAQPNRTSTELQLNEKAVMEKEKEKEKEKEHVSAKDVFKSQWGKFKDKVKIKSKNEDNDGANLSEKK